MLVSRPVSSTGFHQVFDFGGKHNSCNFKLLFSFSTVSSLKYLKDIDSKTIMASYGRVALGNITNVPSRQSMLQPKKSFGGNESRMSLAPNADPRKSLASQSRPSTAPR